MSITLACLDTTHTAESVLEVALRSGDDWNRCRGSPRPHWSRPIPEAAN